MSTENKLYLRCIRCGRILKSQESKEIGYGTVCFNKIKHTSTYKLFDMKVFKDGTENSSISR